MTTEEKLVKIAENREKLVEKGKQAEYDAFWDAMQSNGKRTDYRRAFCGAGWGITTFKPKYDIKPVGDANNMFWASLVTDVVRVLNECGVTLDTSRATNLQYMFGGNSKLTTVPEISLVSASHNSYADYMFDACRKLISIENLILKDDGSLKLTGAFYNCEALTDIKITGVIGQNFDIRWSPLNHDSLTSIINALKDYSADTSGTTYTLRIGEDNIAKLSQTEIDTIVNKRWTYL